MERTPKNQKHQLSQLPKTLSGLPTPVAYSIQREVPRWVAGKEES